MSRVAEGLCVCGRGGVHWADAVGPSPASQSTREHAERGRRLAQPEALKARVQQE